MRDFLPEDVRRREHVIGVIADVYRRYAFEPLETPAVENIETLMGKYGEEGDRLIFKILKRGEEGKQTGEADLALRYDLTVPLARVAAEYRGKLPRVFKRYQVQPVWRADRPQKGRFREFYQCDVDVIGSTSVVVEAELCAAVSDVLERLGFADFTIRLNDRRVLSAVLDRAGIDGPLHGTALVAVDKLDKIGRDGVRTELVARGVAEAAADALLGLFGRVTALAAAGGDANAAVLATLREFLGVPNPVGQGFSPANPVGQGVSPGEPQLALESLDAILSLSRSTSAAPHLRLDPSLARGLSYYTGAIMEIAVPDLAGSLGGGGRYDGLVGMFSGEQVPACGFSLGLERILVVMQERGMFPPGVTAVAADVLVTQWSRERAGEALGLARELRGAGLRVDVYPEADKLGKQFKYAASRGVRFVVVCGDDEAARGEVTVKDMTTGEQRAVGRTEIAEALRAQAAGCGLQAAGPSGRGPGCA
jgi:histidyl-tRNA synthetase